MADTEVTFWIVMVDTDDKSSMPNPIGFEIAVATLEEAKQAAQIAVDRYYLPEYEPVPLVWEHVPFEGGNGHYLAEQAMTAWRDVWTVWPVIMTWTCNHAG